MRGDRFGDRPGHAQQQSEAVAHGVDQHLPALRIERRPRALVEHGEIDRLQRLRVERGRAFGQRDAVAQRQAAVEREAGIGGPAAQVFQLRIRRTGEQQDLQRRAGARDQRHGERIDARTVGAERIQREARHALAFRHGLQREAPLRVRRLRGDDRAGRIAQLDARVRHAVDAAADAEDAADGHRYRHVQLDHAAGQRRRVEFDHPPARGISVALRQAAADDAQALRLRVAAQRRAQIGNALDRRVGGDAGQRDRFRGERQGGELRRRRARRQHDQFVRGEVLAGVRRKQAGVQRGGGEDLQADAREATARRATAAHDAGERGERDHDGGDQRQVHRVAPASGRNASR